MSAVPPEMQLGAEWKGEETNKGDKPGSPALESSLEAVLEVSVCSTAGLDEVGLKSAQTRSLISLPKALDGAWRFQKALVHISSSSRLFSPWL